MDITFLFNEDIYFQKAWMQTKAVARTKLTMTLGVTPSPI